MSNQLSALILFFVSFTSISAWASDARPRPDLRFDRDVDASLKQQILNDLEFMGSLKGSKATPLHRKIFGKVDGQSYLRWFDDRVSTVGKNLCGSDTAVACVLSAWPNKIWMSPNYTKFSQPQIARLSVIYHEARHTEADERFWPHATCPRPFLNDEGKDVRSIWTGALLQGEPACDVTAFGSYGSQTILLKNIALNCDNCTEKVRADADLFANDQLIRIIDPSSKAAMKKDFGMQ